MKKFIEKLKSNKKVLYISIAILILFVGTTFAYVVAQLSGGDFKLFNLNADTTDQLEFNVDKDLSLSANQFNFAEGKGNLTDQAVATARLKANSTKNTATYTYNVYLLIDKNEFKYTTSDKKTEILLQVTDPNGNNLTELSDLKYDTTLQGFDITEVDDELIRIAENHEITSNSSTEYITQNWTIKVTFINLDTNQKMNAGKTLSGKIIIQQKEKYNELKVSIANLPQTYGAIANVTCDGSNVIYDTKYNELQISEFTKDKSRCTLNYTERKEKEYINNKIISLVGTPQGEGQVVQENGYRYEGKNPNNYVWFNNELWRIIGVFDSETHGVANTNLVKITREDSIGVIAWNNSSVNDWSNSSLMNLLNGVYYNKQNGTGNTNCFSRFTEIPGTCDYRNIGIDAGYRGMIKEVTWKLGGHTTNSATTDTFYISERGSATGNNNEYAATKNGYIGLMYPSDYGYSVLASSCARTTYFDSYNSSICSGQSWLYGHGEEWTLTTLSPGSFGAFALSAYGGYVFSENVGLGKGVRPSLYLDASVYVIDGIGTEDNPYIIGM